MAKRTSDNLGESESVDTGFDAETVSGAESLNGESTNSGTGDNSSAGADAGADTGSVGSNTGTVTIELGEQPRKKRGRKPGSTNTSGSGSTKKVPPKLAVNRQKFCRQLVGAHKAASLILKNPLLEISDNEGDALGNAVMDVLDHYQVTVNPVILAYLNLFGVAATIYGPRVFAYTQIKKKAKQFDEAKAAFNGVPVEKPSTAKTGHKVTSIDGVPIG